MNFGTKDKHNTMIEKFTFHEALLGLTHLVAWADGENQGSELDAKVQMLITEQIAESTIDDFKSKHEELSSYEETFNYSMSTLKEESKENQAKACAWMWQIAIIAGVGTDGELDYDIDVWKQDDSKVENEEKNLVEKAMKTLDISSADLKSAFEKLPKIGRI